MEIEIQIHVAGKPINRTYNKPILKLGRTPESDIIINQELVSGNHAKFFVQGNHLLIEDCRSTNGTFVNGEKLTSSVPLNVGDEIRLGESGPKLVVIRKDLETKKPVVAPVDLSKNQEAESNSPFGYSSQKAAPLPGLGNPQDKRTPPLSDRLQPSGFSPNSQDQPAKSAEANSPESNVGLNSPSETRVMLTKLKEKQKWFLILGFGGLGIVSIVGLIYMFSRPNANGDSAGQNQLDFASEIYNKHKDSVFLVRILLEAGSSNPTEKVVGVATAFVVEETGLLATNSHVVDSVTPLLGKKGIRISIVSIGGKKEHIITDAYKHSRYKSNDPTSVDVGILKVKLDEGVKLLPVSLATKDDLKKLSPGTLLCYIGYPSYTSGKEAIEYNNSQKITPRVYQGTALRFRSESGGIAEDSSNVAVVEHNMDTKGGASGSPIFNRLGQVVAIHSGGGSIRLPNNIVIKHNANFGVNIKFIQDILRDIN